MSEPIEFAGSDDSLFRAPLDHDAMIPVLGIPVRFSSNSAAVIAVVESAFRAWRGWIHVDEERGAPAGAHINIVVHPDDEPGRGRVRLQHRLFGPHHVVLSGGGNVAVVNPDRREAHAWVTPAFVADAQHFRYTLVEAITMALLTPLDRQPFHAACLVRGRHAVLLAGPSGVGKSSLTYAAVRGMPGVSALAEDAVYLQARPRLRVWGVPGFAHLPPDMARRFPGLDGMAPVMLANGKTKIAVDLHATGSVATTPFAEHAALCLLSRGRETPGLERITADLLLERLIARLEDGFDLFADTIEEPLRKLTRHGGWLMRLPLDPVDALPWIDRVLSEVRVDAA